MKKHSISIFILILCLYLTLAQHNENCECSPPCLGANENLSQCPGRKAPRLDCPCCEVCLQQGGKKCQEPDLPCDKMAGLHCSPRQKGLCQECGVNRRDPFLTRIFGGQPASPKDWPWMAALVKAHQRGAPFCGGTLISDSHVVTASHCLENFSPREVIVRLGEYDFSKTVDNNPMDFEIKKIQTHEKYNRVTFDNDIAILSLKNPVNFNEYIWPVCLPPPNMNFAEKLGLVAGWGSDAFLGPTTNILREVTIQVWAQDECVKAHAGRTITDNMMCIGWRSGKADSCQGDSGGPFVLKLDGTHQWLLTGIVSWGQECGARFKPGVYTVVAKYLDWIEYHTQRESPSKPAAPEEDATSPSDFSTLDCGNGYEQIKSIDWCVKANTDTKNWWQASQTCESDGGSLAVIDTKEKFDAISEMIQTKKINDLWIGLSDLKFEGNFEWVDGTRLSKESSSWWGPSQPDDGEQNEDCVHFSSSWQYKWNDVICYALFSYLCEKKVRKKNTALRTQISDNLKAPTAASCPNGWTMNPDSKLCFHVGDEKLSFDKSKEYCRNKEGYLAMVLSSAEMSFARGFLHNNKCDEAWIGLRRSRTGLFRWIDDRPLSFRSWALNAPDNREGKEDCVSMDRSNSYLWNDDECYKFKRPLCMKKIPSRGSRST